jgi:uncharacterized membrane protein
VAELLGLLFSIVFLLVIFLPILTFLRLGRMMRELDELRARVARLEAKPSAPGAPSAPAAPVAPVAPSAPTAPIAPTFAPDGATVGRPSASAPGEDLEERIGGRGLLYTGVFVLLLGISFFLKYAFDNEWINETARTLIGALAGAGLVFGGRRLAASGLATYGQALIGAGFAVLYLVVYAALNFYGLITRGPAFLAMIVITGAAVFAAHQQRAQALAVIAVTGGFLTPLLVGGNDNAQLTLFTYVEILIIATMLLSLRHQWPALNALSYAGTVITVVAWAARFYHDALWLRTLLFLTLFAIAFVIVLRETRKIPRWSARAVSMLLATAPVLYHIAAVVLTAGHPPAIHIYLITFTAVGLWLAVDPYRPLLRFVVLLAALVPMFGTTTLPGGASWLIANVVTISAVALLHIMSLVDRVTRQDSRLGAIDLLTFHVTGLGLFALLAEALQPRYPEARGALAAAVALGVIVLGRALRPRDEVAYLHALALTFTLVAIAVAVQFDGLPVVLGWAAEGAAVAWIGVRTRVRAFAFGGFVLWVLAAPHLVDTFYETPAQFTVLLNARSVATLFVLVCGYVLAWRVAASEAPEAGRLRTTLHVVASALTLAWITAEIRSFWLVRADSAHAHVYEQMLLSLAWGVYGAVLIAVGMWRRYAIVRYIGIAIIGVTSLKVFFYDLWELGGIYRVIGFIGFGGLLVLVSYLYQNRRRADADRPEL